MERYSESVELQMQYLYDSLSEKDSRRYAAIEAAKIGHGGIKYISDLFECDPKTIEHGLRDLESFPKDEAGSRIRKKGADARQLAFRNQVLSRLRKRRSKRKLLDLP